MKVEIGEYEDTKKRNINVRIDEFDTWNMDITLAYIIHPMLIQLKDTKHGAPFVEGSDVPLGMEMSEEALVGYKERGETDALFFTRWEWVLNEMIWAFGEIQKDSWESKYYGPLIKDENHPLGSRFEWVKHEDMKAHQNRISNGFRLFGKYYQDLWD